MIANQHLPSNLLYSEHLSLSKDQLFSNQSPSKVLSVNNNSEIIKDESNKDESKSGIDIQNIAKAVKKDSSNKITINELGEKINSIDLSKKNSNNIETGTLSNLRSIVNAEELLGNVEKDVPTPSGIENCRFFIMKMLDEPFSGRNYPLKSHMKDNSAKNENTPNPKPTEKATNFSYFIKQNALVNYYDNSPKRKRDLPSQKLKEKNQQEQDNDQGNDQDNEQEKVQIQTVDFEDNDDSSNPQANMKFSNFQVFASNDVPSSSDKAKMFFGSEDNNKNLKPSNANETKSSNNMFLNMNVNMNVVAPGYIDYGNMNNNKSIKSMSTSDDQQNILSFAHGNINSMKNSKKETITNKQNKFLKQKNSTKQGNLNLNSPSVHSNSQNQFYNQMSQINYNQPFELFMSNLSNNQMNIPWNQSNMNMFNPHLIQSNMQSKDFFMNPYMNQLDYYSQQGSFPNSFINPYLQQQQQQLHQFQFQQQQQQQQQQKFNNQIIKKKKSKALMQNLSNLSQNELIKSSNTICKDQSGCRFLQKKIDENPNLVQPVIQNMLKNVIEIMTDPFGNYLIQKLFDYMTHEQLCQLMALLQIYIYQICCNSHGTRVIQKLIDYINTETLIQTFTNLIKPVIKDIILNINGSHIVLKLIDLNNLLATKAVYEEICSNIFSIATHKHGCCVLQKCIEKSPPKMNQKLMALLIENCQELILDQCGNYIIQYIITLQNESIHEGVIDHLIKDILSFSKQKYSSNVVEKCFECCNDKICQKLLISLRDSHICIKLLFDKFGNYVIQKALHRADDDSQHFILDSIAPCIQKLKNYPFGMKLYNKLIITYPYLSQKMLKVDQCNVVDNEDNGKEDDNNDDVDNNNFENNDVNNESYSN